MILYEGKTDQDDGSYAHLSKAVAVAQYDPLGQEGTLSHVIAGAEWDLTPFIWDRTEDNKLYFRFRGLEAAADPASYDYNLQLRTTFFDAEASNWKAVAAYLVTVPEPSTIGLLLAGGVVLLLLCARTGPSLRS